MFIISVLKLKEVTLQNVLTYFKVPVPENYANNSRVL